MKKLHNSFRRRLMVSFLVVSLVPLLICSVLLVQISRLRTNSQTRQELQEMAAGIRQSMNTISDGFLSAAQQLQANPIVTAALSGSGGTATQVNNALFLAADPIRDHACVLLCGLDGTARYSTKNAHSHPALDTNWGILYAAAGADGEAVYTTCQSVPNETDPLVQGAVLLKSDRGEALGYLVMELYYDDLASLLDGKYGTQGDLLLLSPYFHPVYASNTGMYTALAPQLRGCLMSGGVPADASENYMYEIARHEATGLYLVLQYPLTFNRRTMNLLYAASVICALICVVISVVMSVLMSHQLSSPIQHLRQAFGKVEADDLNVQVSIRRNDELGELAQNFNHMVQALKQNREELVRNQRELNEAQIRMLQAQLNPHFLCNTLDTMKWISKINHVPQVAMMSTNLADILRFCISADEFVPLYQEVEILYRYIEIQRVRLSDTFTFQVVLPEELSGCMVPKMILQPIVENAILHGLNGVDNCHIQVEAARTEDNMLRVTVTDNGHGLPPDMVGKPYCRDKALAGNHLGLYNVDTILSKHYGDGFGLYLDCGPDHIGTSVTATLPIRKEDALLC